MLSLIGLGPDFSGFGHPFLQEICDRGKIGLIALHLNFTKLGLFMLNTIAIILALAR